MKIPAYSISALLRLVRMYASIFDLIDIWLEVRKKITSFKKPHFMVYHI